MTGAMRCQSQKWAICQLRRIWWLASGRRLLIPGHCSRWTVGILAVADDSNVDDPLRVVDRVNDPVVTDSDPPQVIGTPQFLAARRSWLRGKRVDLRSDTVDDLTRQ